MYNEEQKMRFILEASQSESTRQRIKWTLNRISAYEEEKKKDLCEMSDEDVIKAAIDVSGVSRQTQEVTMITFRKYAKWCVENNIPNARSFDGINIGEDSAWVDKFRQQMISGPKQLQEFLDIAFDDEFLNTNDIAYRCFFWLGFAGMDVNEVMNIRASDVSLQRMVVCYDSKEYELYEEGVDAFERCTKLTEFNRVNKKTSEFIGSYTRAPGDILLRGVGGSVSDVKVFIGNVSRRVRNSGVRTSGKPGSDLKYARVKMSGIFYRTYEAEKLGIQPDYRAMAMTYSKLPEEERSTKVGSILNLATEFKENYRRWKQAFCE